MQQLHGSKIEERNQHYKRYTTRLFSDIACIMN